MRAKRVHSTNCDLNERTHSGDLLSYNLARCLACIHIAYPCRCWHHKVEQPYHMIDTIA